MPDDVHIVRAATFDEMLDAVLVADDNRRYVDVNRAACDLFGCTRDELLSMRVEDVFPAGTADVAVLWREFLGEGSQTGEFTSNAATDAASSSSSGRARTSRRDDT